MRKGEPVHQPQRAIGEFEAVTHAIARLRPELHQAKPRAHGLRVQLGKPRHIVSPIVLEVVIQEDWWKQAELQR